MSLGPLLKQFLKVIAVQAVQSAAQHASARITSGSAEVIDVAAEADAVVEQHAPAYLIDVGVVEAAAFYNLPVETVREIVDIIFTRIRMNSY